MLLLLKNYNEIDISQLLNVCRQSNTETGRREYYHMEIAEQLRFAEYDFCDYIRENLSKGLLLCAVWAPDGCYKSFLRLEQYLDGYLIAGLETALQERRKGYAEALIRTLLTTFSHTRIYSHIAHCNNISTHLHVKLGFEKIKDYAIALDGTVSNKMATYYICT